MGLAGNRRSSRRYAPRQRVVEPVEPLGEVECVIRASRIPPVAAFYDYLYLGLSIPLCNRRLSIHLM
jgi:hypothetical protein